MRVILDYNPYHFSASCSVVLDCNINVICACSNYCKECGTVWIPCGSAYVIWLAYYLQLLESYCIYEFDLLCNGSNDGSIGLISSSRAVPFVLKVLWNIYIITIAVGGMDIDIALFVTSRKFICRRMHGGCSMECGGAFTHTTLSSGC